MHRFVSCLAILTLVCALPAADPYKNRDLIVGSDSRPKYCFIVSERYDGLVFKTSSGATKEESWRYTKVSDIQYKGMRGDGTWKVLIDEKKRGEYPAAASRAQALAGQGREWHKAYGYMQEGDCWERYGAYDRAVTAFGKFVADPTLADHRWYIDALYRQGVNLARLEKLSEAKAVVETLNKWGNEKASESRNLKNQASARGQAILCAIAAAEGKTREAATLEKKVIWPRSDELVRAHWGGFWAGFLRKNSAFAEAAKKYENLLKETRRPEDRAILSLGLGVCLAEEGRKEQAQLYLLVLDAMPYGSPEQRLEARYYAGKIKWELAEKLKKTNKEKRIAFGELEAAEGRRMLKQAAAAVIDSPFKAKAEEYLSKLPPEEAADAKSAEGDKGAGEKS